MIRNLQGWSLVEPRRLLYALGFSFAAIFLLSLSQAAPALASDGGGNSGDGSGSGNCSISYGYTFVKSWSEFNASGQSCGPSYYNNGKSRAELAAVNATECYDNRNQLDGIWYLTGDAARSIWLRHPSSHRSTKAEATAFVNRSSASEEMKRYARQAIQRGGTPVVIVCTWPGQRGVACKDIAAWDTKVRFKGAKGSDRYDDASVARRNCILHCPKKTPNFSKNRPTYWVKSNRSEKMVPVSSGGMALNGDRTARDNNRGSWCFERPSETEPFERTQRQVREEDSSSEVVLTDFYPFTWRTEASGGVGTSTNPHPGPTQFVPQCSQPTSSNPSAIPGDDCYQYTAFGQYLLDLVGSTDPLEWTEIINAVVETNESSRVGFDLSETNVTALSEGGVLNVLERTSFAAVVGEVTTRTPRVRTRSQDCVDVSDYNFQYSRGGVVRLSASTTSSCGSWSSWSEWRDAPELGTGEDPVVTLSLSAQMPVVTRFWQALSAHCNPEGMAAQAAGNEVVANGDPTKALSGTLITPVMDNADNPVWGPHNLDDSFFDRECAFEGVRSGGSKPAEVTHFRDNQLRTVEVPKFVPASSALVEYDGSEALSTTVTRWNPGTPQVNGITDKGALRVLAEGEEVFSPGALATGAAAPVQRNWEVEEFKSRNLGILEGEHTEFDVAGTWASEAGKPSVFTYKWEYDPIVNNVMPLGDVGFSGPAGARSYDLDTHGVPIQGKVYANFESDRSAAKVTELSRNTGTGVVNNLDGVLYWGTDLTPAGKWRVSPSSTNPYYQTLNFVRSTSK